MNISRRRYSDQESGRLHHGLPSLDVGCGQELVVLPTSASEAQHSIKK